MGLTWQRGPIVTSVGLEQPLPVTSAESLQRRPRMRVGASWLVDDGEDVVRRCEPGRLPIPRTTPARCRACSRSLSPSPDWRHLRTRGARGGRVAEDVQRLPASWIRPRWWFPPPSRRRRTSVVTRCETEDLSSQENASHDTDGNDSVLPGGPPRRAHDGDSGHVSW